MDTWQLLKSYLLDFLKKNILQNSRLYNKGNDQSAEEPKSQITSCWVRQLKERHWGPQGPNKGNDQSAEEPNNRSLDTAAEAATLRPSWLCQYPIEQLVQGLLFCRGKRFPEGLQKLFRGRYVDRSYVLLQPQLLKQHDPCLHVTPVSVLSFGV